ncbi:MAG: RNA polymerase sigma factor [Gammaproteobacteria bacterium]|nr:MAG: RNA polymerase sigma factor [Gammaproteobacteria bacterium]
MTDEECLTFIRLGGKKAEQGIAQLYRRYSRPFKRYFIRHGLSQDIAEDLVQETFLNVVRHCSTFRNDCEIKVWLWKIARNAMLGFLRKQKPAHEDIDEWIDALPDCEVAECASLSLEECVREAFQRFGQDHRERAETLTLAAVQGWSTAELAEFLGRSLGATRQYVSQCRKFFKPYLEPCREFL